MDTISSSAQCPGLGNLSRTDAHCHSILHSGRTDIHGSLSFDRRVVAYRSCFVATNVLAVGCAAACGGLVELSLQPIVVIVKSPYQGGKDDSQVDVVCLNS